MGLRYKLSKDAFKGKKVPPKIRSNEDHISADQRGDDAYVGRPRTNLLSLDKKATSAESGAGVKDKPPEESSRRNLFSSLFGKYKDQEEEKIKVEKQAKKKRRKVKRKKGSKKAGAGLEATLDPALVEEELKNLPQVKIGFFKKIWRALRAWCGDPIAVELEEMAEAEARLRQARQAVLAKLNPGLALENAEAPDRQPSTEPGIAAQTNRELLENLKAESQAPAEALSPGEDEEDPGKDVSRRQMLREGFHFFAKPAVDGIQKKVDRVNETVNKITKRMPLIRPPGAITERQFLQACTRCDKCIHVCPPDALRKAPKSFGLLVVGTPYIDPLKNPCVMCTDLPCIPACPEGALLPVAEPADVKMGYAILDKEKCMAYGDTYCQQCVIDCPIPGAIVQDQEQRPSIIRSACTGCSVCVRSCSTVNIPVAIKVKPQMVIDSQLRKKEMEREKAEEDARKKAEETEDMRQEILAQRDEENDS